MRRLTGRRKEAPDQARRPRNILFIVADDLNGWIGALNRHPDVKTPNIDALARRGTLFTHAYCSAPYCNASRMSVFTGCLPTTTGVYSNEAFWETELRRPTFLEELRAAGYYTFGAGKVFHGVFDYAAAGRAGANEAAWLERENRLELWDEFVENRSEPLPEHRPMNGFFDFSDFESVPPAYHHFDWGPIPDGREEELPDHRVAEAVKGFLARQPKEPFFCAAGIYKPHLPWHVPSRFFDMYDKDKLSLPLVKWDDLDDVPEIARTWALNPNDHELIMKTGQWREAVQGYLAAISYCDHIVGEILEALEQSGLADETAVVLWGDNGFHLGEKLHWRKFVLWEEATLVPLIVSLPWNNGASGQQVHTPVSLVDLYPTLLSLAGLSVDHQLDGEELCSLLDEPTRERERGAVMTWGEGNDSVRTSKWRLTRYRDGSTELYDHRSDPFEWTNLASDPRYEQVKAELSSQLPPPRPEEAAGG